MSARSEAESPPVDHRYCRTVRISFKAAPQHTIAAQYRDAGATHVIVVLSAPDEAAALAPLAAALAPLKG